jgi:NAD(P)H-quinone oxidoreductase subunit 6
MTIASTTQLICFVALSAAVAIGALGVVLLPNIVYSAFLLGGVFLSVAGLYLLLNASFVAAAQVLVYVGAVNVLILFAIMLVNKQGKPRRLSQAWPCVGCCRRAVCARLVRAAACGWPFTTPWALPERPSSRVRRSHDPHRRAPVQRLPVAV